MMPTPSVLASFELFEGCHVSSRKSLYMHKDANQRGVRMKALIAETGHRPISETRTILALEPPKRRCCIGTKRANLSAAGGSQRK